MSRALRVLALATYPERAAATRQRVLQFVPLLHEQGIDMDVRPFLSNRVFAGFYDRKRVMITAGGILAGVARRVRDVARFGAYDVAFVQREAALVGPPLVEWLAHRRMPIVLDLDDSTYLERESAVFGSLATSAKWRGKTDQLIRWSEHVICGNPTIAAYVERFATPTTILPTIVDVERFTPRAQRGEGALTIGWIGTHSTFAYLRELLVPVFQRLARTHRFRLRIVGSGETALPIEGVDVELLPWSEERELDDLRSFDVAVYPIVADAWAEGKSGFKAVQYQACGVPYVASPVGVVAEMGIAGQTHLEARSEDEWVAALTRLIEDGAFREEMGRQGRAYAEAHYSTRRTAELLGNVLREAAHKKDSRR
jgi:glycosyltransferase involved in cell wall biosynthesis